MTDLEIYEPTSLLPVSQLSGEHLLRSDCGYLSSDGRVLIVAKLKVNDAIWSCHFSTVCTVFGRLLTEREVILGQVPEKWIWWLICDQNQPDFYWIRCSYHGFSNRLLITKVSIPYPSVAALSAPTVTHHNLVISEIFRIRTVCLQGERLVIYSCLCGTLRNILTMAVTVRRLILVNLKDETVQVKELNQDFGMEIKIESGPFIYDNDLCVFSAFSKLRTLAFLNLDSCHQQSFSINGSPPKFIENGAFATGFPIKTSHCVHFFSDDCLYVIGSNKTNGKLSEEWWRLDLHNLEWMCEYNGDKLAQYPNEFYSSKTYTSSTGILVTLWKSNAMIHLTKRWLREKNQPKSLQNMAFETFTRAVPAVMQMTRKQQRKLKIPPSFCVLDLK